MCMHLLDTHYFQAGEKTYEGFGNPDAWILVIGNEPEFDEVENRISGRAAKKYQGFVNRLSLRRRAPGYEYFHRLFFTDIRQIIRQETWLTEPELVKTFLADDFESLFSCDFVKQFPIVIISLEDEVWKYGLDIARLMNIAQKGNLVESIDGRQWYRLFESESSKEPRLVIHTRQISNKDTNPEFIHMITGALYNFCVRSEIPIRIPDRDRPLDLPIQTIEFGNFLTAIIDAANAPIDEKPVVKCRMKKCKGTLVITVNPDNSISYHCTHCDKSTGIITRSSNR